MRLRYLSFLSLGLAAVFLVVATVAFPLSTVVELSLGVGIGMMVVSLAIADHYRHHVPSLVVGICSASVSAWMIVSSQVFSRPTVDDLTFASAVAVGTLAAIGLTAHELSAERMVHSAEAAAGGHSAAPAEGDAAAQDELPPSRPDPAAIPLQRSILPLAVMRSVLLAATVQTSADDLALRSPRRYDPGAALAFRALSSWCGGLAQSCLRRVVSTSSNRRP